MNIINNIEKSNDVYYNKYLKYKLKYLFKQEGGNGDADKKDIKNYIVHSLTKREDISNELNQKLINGTLYGKEKFIKYYQCCQLN